MRRDKSRIRPQPKPVARCRKPGGNPVAVIKTLANGFGAVLLLAGLVGLVPMLAPHGLLLQTFHVNTALNLLHLFSGAAAVWCGLSSALASRVYFRLFGGAYLAVAMIGFLSDTG